MATTAHESATTAPLQGQERVADLEPCGQRGASCGLTVMLPGTERMSVSVLLFLAQLKFPKTLLKRKRKERNSQEAFLADLKQLYFPGPKSPGAFSGGTPHPRGLMLPRKLRGCGRGPLGNRDHPLSPGPSLTGTLPGPPLQPGCFPPKQARLPPPAPRRPPR